MHNRKCLECGTIGKWNWAKKREEKLMPNGELVKVRVIVKGEGEVKCSKCGHTFEPHSHTRLDIKLEKVFG